MRQRQLSIAKITRPRITGVYERKRLFKLLDQGRDKPVTWISGPAGSGKTTLVASWLDSRKLPCLWYQVDEGDADIATFFYYMGLAAKKAAPRFRKPIPLLTPEYAFGIPVFTRRFFEELYSRLVSARGHVLVFDNYHHIPEASPLHEIMQIGLSTIPEGVTVIVTGRAEPPAMFSGLRANNQMEVIGWDALRLTPEESRGIVQLEKDQRLSTEAVTAIHEKAGGWAAGLILMAKGTGSSGEPHADGALRPEETFDYFASELFDKADGPVREFLLRTSVLPRITPSMAEKLSKNKNAGTILAELNRRNYFTEKRTQPDAIYQYHALFREFLITRAASRFPFGELSGLRREAATLLEASGQTEDAAELFMQAGAWKELISLVLANAHLFVGQGRNKLLEKWITALPEELPSSDPWLLYWLGSCRMPFDVTEGRKCFERSFGIFRDQNNTQGAFVAWTAIVNAIWHEWDDLTRMDPWIEWMENALKQNPSFASSEIEASVSAGMFFALSRRRPDHASLTTWSARALQLTLKVPVSLFLQVRMMALWNAATKGERKEYEALLDEMRNEQKRSSPSPFDVVIIRSLEAQMNALYHASAEKGLREVQENLRLADETGIHCLDHHLCAIGVYCALNKGDIELAGEYLAKSRMIVSEKQRDSLGQFLFLAGWYALLTGDIATARSHAERAVNLSLETGIPSSELFCRHLMAHVLIKQGEYQQASDQIASAKKLAYRIGSRMMINRCLLVEARIAFSRGDQKAGLKLLRDALAAGREIDFISMLFHWQPAIMADLCARALENGIEVEYAKRHIRELQLLPEKPSLHIENWPWPVKFYTMGRFRIEVAGKPLTFSGKVQKKPLEMLKALVAFGGDEVTEGRITDALWPDADGDTARISFKTTLHRLRQLIGNENAVQLQDGKVSLDRRYCWTDVWAFEHALESSEFGVRSSKLNGEKNQSAIHNQKFQIEKAVALYTGRFLPGDEDRPWAVSLRERLRNKFLRAVGMQGESWERSGKLTKAVDCYEKGLEVDDLAEDFYRRLMVCHHKLGRKADAVKVYERCKSVLSASLGVEPSEETERAYAALRTGQR